MLTQLVLTMTSTHKFPSLLVGAVGDGKEVGRHLVPPLADVHPHHAVGVDRVPLVRVDHHAEQARVSLNKNYVEIRFCIVLIDINTCVEKV